MNLFPPDITATAQTFPTRCQHLRCIRREINSYHGLWERKIQTPQTTTLNPASSCRREQKLAFDTEPSEAALKEGAASLWMRDWCMRSLRVTLKHPRFKSKLIGGSTFSWKHVCHWLDSHWGNVGDPETKCGENRMRKGLIRRLNILHVLIVFPVQASLVPCTTINNWTLKRR